MPKHEQSCKILFIGNSYTFFSDMPTAIFEKLAKIAGYKNVTVSSVTKGGWFLERHADAADAAGAQVDQALKENKYEYVILQEQSLCPALTPGRFYDGVRALHKKIKANGATPVFYSTWGRKTGNKHLEEHGWTHESMTWKLAAAYTAIGEELGIASAYVGLAFHDVYTNHAARADIYDEDGSHPSFAGSYLAALTLFAKIFGEDPTEVKIPSELDDETVSLLQEAARKAVFETPEIPAIYRTSSVGVIKTEG